MRRLPDIRREEGQGLVEFALVLPILLMVATGIASFGIVFYRYITLTDAVRSGARTLSLGRGASNPCDDARNQTVNSAFDVGLTASQVTLDVNNSGRCSNPGNGTDWTKGRPAKVSAQISYSITIFGSITVTNGILKASATDAVE